MDDAASAAALELTSRRLKQAAGSTRKALRHIRAAGTEYDCFGQAEINGEQDLDGVRELASLALAQYGRVDVVLLVRAPAPTPKAPQNGAKENTE